MYQVDLTESYFPAQTDIAIEDATVGDILRRAAEQAPDRIALKELLPDGAIGRTWTYQELLAVSEKLAHALLSRHKPGDRIGIWAPNIPEWVIMEMAAGLAGLTLVTLNPSYQAREVKYVLEQSRSTALYMIEGFRGNPMGDIARQVVNDLDAVTHMIDLQDEAALYAGADQNTPLPSVAPMDPVQIQYTSGTTGFPKGAVLHHRGLVNNAVLFADRWGYKAGDTMLAVMPLFHTAGCALSVLGTVGQQATMVLPVMFDPGLAIDTVPKEKISHLVGVPTMIVGMLEAYAANPVDVSSVRGISSGGSMVAPDLVNKAREVFGVTIQIIYGQTETSPTITLMHGDASLEDATQTVGQPLAQTECAILNPETNAVMPVGEIGEICSRGYLNMIGYNDNPEATAATIDKDGWLHTGDLGRMDARGFVTITGRVKEMIIRGGENLFPAEIENAMLEHPALAEVAVVGIPDDKWGEVVACFMRPTGSDKPGVPDLKAFCRERLSPQKTPLHWIYVDEWPLTGSGKIRKFLLRDEFVEGKHAPLEG